MVARRGSRALGRAGRAVAVLERDDPRMQGGDVRLVPGDSIAQCVPQLPGIVEEVVVLPEHHSARLMYSVYWYVGVRMLAHVGTVLVGTRCSSPSRSRVGRGASSDRPSIAAAPLTPAASRIVGAMSMLNAWRVPSPV